MSGTESAHANAASNGGGGGFDLLKRATQAMMMSRSAAAEDDGEIGYDTPRSGIATPKPDLHDKRLPGITTYFTQVGAESPCNTGSLTTPPEEKAVQISTESAEKNGMKEAGPEQTAVSGVAGADAGVGIGAAAAGPSPNSHTVSAQQPAEDVSVFVFRPVPAVDQVRSGGETAGPPADPAEGITSGSADSDTDLVEPTDGSPMSSTRPSSVNSELDPAAAGPTAWFSFGMLKKLTTGTLYKSGACTPTRALSTTHPSRADDNGLAPARGNSNESAAPSRSQTPRPAPVATATAGAPAGAHVPLTKGKLTIKIVEARGLKKSNAPYVVVVFQRNELISDSPHSFEEEEEDTTNLATPGQTMIQRQGSDSGRPPMAIPMRSRQSSNTSIHDYSTIRNRPTRTSFTNPKWDAEAVFDVMDSDMRVDISIYDQGPVQTQAQSQAQIQSQTQTQTQSQTQTQQQQSQSGGGTSATSAPASGPQPSGEAILGNVHFRMSIDKDTPIQGWFPLRGHVNTEAEDAPTGEIYVEASYQRTEKKHFGPEDFQILRLIGKGTFGQVYQVRKKDTQRIYAMKVLSKKVIVQKKEVAHTVGERNILVRTATSDSPFIVGLKYSFQTPSDLYLVTDFLSGGELFWHLQKEGRFDETRAKFYIAELILAIQHLHDNDIVYRDLKPENILLDANGHIALCDFGLSKANLTKNDTTNTFCGTTEYLAPEVLLDESGYSKMVDFWSLGVLVFEMCCGWSPFYAEDTQQMYKNIAFGKVRFPRETLSQDGRNFVKGLLNRNPKHRLGAIKDAEELKNHAFFADIDWDLLSKKLITPPFKPKLKSETDVSYFDPEFTNALDNNGSLNERAAALAGGFATSTPLSPSMQANFQGFTFVDESALEDHMKDRGQSDDEEMNDGNNHGANHDDDWDSLDDMHPHGANRMSGIVRTTTNEDQMFGETQFDD